ncbi:MAG TPA: ATP-binding protein [Candidatus Eisenbacteria bacterium]|nr:ATP-binding protein [Candidatus Eisenbacteria bacterium]
MITKDAPEDPPAGREVVSSSGEMAARIHEYDWGRTPLGPMDSWSPSLKMMVRFLLVNRFPLLLWWGPRFLQIYNDPYRPVLGSKHPNSLGQPAAECWPEIWPIIGPLVETPFRGGPPTWMEDIALEPNRHGFAEETHFTIAYSPVPDETVESGIGGVLATVHEITEKVIGERRVAALRDLGTRALETKTAEDACEAAAEIMSKYPKDAPFALIYLVDESRRQARLAASSGVGIGESASPRAIDLEGEAAESATWPLAEVIRTESSIVVEDLATRLPRSVPAGPWSDPPRQAVVVPIRSNMPHQLAGMLVVGVSARIALDDSYKSFFELAASQIATAIANARAYDEERKRAEALAEIDRAKTTFFSNVSHEFRTPLTLMLGPLEEALSRAEGQDLPGGKDLVEIAHRNGLRLLKLVNALLDYSRIEAGRAKLSTKTEDLCELTAVYASMFRSAMDRAGLEFQVECEPLPSLVRVDRDAWEKIVLNLVSNAFKYTLEGRVTVTMRSDEDRAVLTVTDTGTGIASHELPNLFKRFHRVEGARGRTHEGTGIGLSLVKELVHLHGGRITVKSELGRGSTFRVELPLSTDAAPTAAQDRRQHEAEAKEARAFVEEALRWLPDADVGDRDPALPLRQGRVLLADDNADVRQYLRGLLEAVGYSVMAVANGQEALAAARHERPDLILTDVMMPIMDGFALLAAVRSDPSLTETPVIMLSARAGEESKVEGLEHGADDYLVKPFSAKELVARVASNLSLARIRRESAERVTSILESLSDAFQSIDANGRYLYVNGAMRKLLTEQGIDPSSIIGKHVFEAFPEWRDTEIGRAFLKAHEERTYVELESKYAPFDRWYAVRFHPDREGGLSVLSEDITARKDAEANLRQRTEERQHLLESERAARMEAERLGRVKDEFLATLSHELRTPLNSILGWARLVRKDSENRELREKALEVIERNSHAQAQLISDLLDMSRVISGKLRLEFDQVDLPLVIEGAVELLKPTAEARGVTLRTALGPLRGTVHGDAERLQQVVWNLISNAIKFTETGGWAEIELSDVTTGAEIRVRDCGKGIRAEFLPHLFERFRQEDPSAAREHGGLGIGLALVKQLVDLHGGLVRAESQGEGLGATFRVILPYVMAPSRFSEDDPAVTTKGWARGDMPRLSGIKVLVVDDEEDARELLRRLLEESDAQVLTASSAGEAMRLLARESPQVLLSDVGMPGHDGYQFIREVRASGSTIPAVALTAFARSEDRTKALLSGFQSHLAKPFEPAELLVTVAALAGRMGAKA